MHNRGEGPSGPRGWRETVNGKMKQVLERLKASIEELGVKFTFDTSLTYCRISFAASL